MHKDDKKSLIPAKLYYKIEKEEEWELVGNCIIPSRVLNYEEYKDILIKVIKEKNAKSEQYNKDLKYIELFIKDCENVCDSQDEKFLINLAKDKELLDIVVNSAFRTVYIFSKHENRDILFTIGEDIETQLYKRAYSSNMNT